MDISAKIAKFNVRGIQIGDSLAFAMAEYSRLCQTGKDTEESRLRIIEITNMSLDLIRQIEEMKLKLMENPNGT